MPAVSRVIEGAPGEEAEVWVQDRGGACPRLRTTVVIEDLDDVLTTIAARSGANGPQNPVTQYILAEAASYLADRLMDDAVSGDRDSVPRILSSALGHQPFIEQVLGMSQHQMLRRWPLAADWYTDVVNYVMRPQRFDTLHAAAVEQMVLWTSGPFGEFLRQFGDAVVQTSQPEKIVRVAEALQCLWPEYAPVREALDLYRRQVRDLWVPLWLSSAARYGLKVRPGVDPEDIAWAFNSLQARETLERLGNGAHGRPMTPDGPPWTNTARAALLLVAGAVTDAAGHMVPPEELVDRMPTASIARGR